MTAARSWVRSHPVVAVSAVLAVPLVVATIVLLRERWAPVLDLAMTELRVRDVGGSHTPLIGLPGRIGSFPEQGSHPGPLSFYLLAPIYRLFGSTGPALEAASAALVLVAIVAALLLARRRGGAPMTLAVGVMLAALLALEGPAVPTQPWNPYLPTWAWIVVLVATWSVLDRDLPALVPLVAFGSLAAQTHVPYVGLSGGLALVAFAVVGTRAARTPKGDPTRRAALRWSGLALGLGFVLWLPPILDELFGQGNLSTIVRHFSNPPESPVGMSRGFELLLEHFDLVHAFQRPDYSRLFVAVSYRSESVPAIGAVFLGVWLLAAIGSVVCGWRRVWPLHATVAAALVLGLVSLSRIFGATWFYLSFWMVPIVALAMLSTVWTAAIAWSSRRTGSIRRLGAVIGVGALLVLVGVATVESLHASPPDSALSRSLVALADQTDSALRRGAGGGAGTSGRYLVTWADADFIGAQGYGLVNELERRGYRVGVPELYHVPTTRHRVFSGRRTAEIRLATGKAVAAIERAHDPRVHRVARFDPRDRAARRHAAELRRRLRAHVRGRGRSRLADQLDGSLFALSLDPRLDRTEHRMVTELIRLGEDSAVFVVRPNR